MTTQNETQYLDMMRHIFTNGMYRKPENEEGRLESFAQTMRFDLTNNKLPLLTTKNVFFKGLAVEMLWFLSGSQNIQMLLDHNVHIWDEWINKDGEVGPLYGYQWRHWQVDPKTQSLHNGATEIDQVAEVMKSLRDKPEARSHMVTAWRPDHLKAMSIKPCHIMLQFYRFGDEISLMLTQRSCDAFLGVPFNIAQYSLLTHMVAHQLGCTAKSLIWHGGDVHIYENHIDQVKEQLCREPTEGPTISFARKPDSIFDYKYEDFIISNYNPQSRLTAEVSIQGQAGKGVTL